MKLLDNKSHTHDDSHSRIVKIINKMFEPLDANERDLLCYCAYINREILSYNLDEYYNSISKNLPPNELKNCAISLKRKGYLWSYYSNFFYNANIICQYVIPALYYLITERRNLYEKIRKSKISVTNDIEYICQVIECVSQGIDCKSKLAKFAKPTMFEGSYYFTILYFPEMRILADVVHPIYINNFISYAINTAQTDDIDNYIPFLEQLATKIEIPEEMIFAKEALAYARYCYDGTYEEIQSPSCFWGYLLKGIYLAYNGDIELAADVFAKGLIFFNKCKNVTVKNVYSHTLPAYYSTICFSRSTKQSHKNKFCRLSTKYRELGDVQLNPAKILTLYYDNNEHLGIYTKQWCDELSKASYRNSYALCRYIANYLELKEVDTSLPIRKPIHKILAHEMRRMFTFSQDELDDLNKLYGEKSLLEHEHRLASWELTLNKVLEVASAEVGNNEPSTLRISYIVSKDLDVDIRLQSRLKSGNWGKPRHLTYARFLELDEDTLDEYDIRVRDKISNYYNCKSDKLLSVLVGCDRVFVEIGAKLTPAVVDMEQAFVLLEKGEKGEYKFTSNLKLSDLQDSTKVKIVAKSRTHFSVIKITNAQLIIFKELLKMPTLPAEAEPVLRNFLSNISPNIGVHSSSIEGAETLNSVQGDPEVVIRIYPATNLTFTPNVLVRPVKGCTELCAPGKGVAILIDKVNGVRCQIMRKLTREHELVNNLRQYIEDLTGGIFDNTQLQAQQMLELMDYVKEKPEYSIEWPEGAELKLKAANESSWSIHMNKTEQWFEVEGEVSIDMNTVLSLAQLLDAVSKSDGKFVKLSDRDYLLISESIKRQLEQLSKIASISGGKVRVSPLQAAIDNEIFGQNGLVKVDDVWKNLRTKIFDSYKKVHRLPNSLQAELRDYQYDGYLWLKRLTAWGGGACLADDMGLGKTVQTIAYLLSEAKYGAALVVVPASVLPNWRNELARFAPSLNVKVLNNFADRRSEISSADSGDVVLTTYGLLISEEASLTVRKWHVVCLDEAHVIKNRDAKMSKVAMQLHADNRIALTGTPIQNHLGELWNLFQFLNPGLFGTYEQFQQKYITPIECFGNKDVQRQLKRTIAPFMLRRTKKEVAEELPDKTEIKISVELTDEETAIYETLRTKAEHQLQSNEKVDVKILSQITQLRRAACTPQLVYKDFTGESSKLKTFLSLVDDISSTNNKMLVFSQFTSFLKLAKNALDKVNVQYLYFDGSSTISQREKIIEQFRNDDDCQLLLISLKAGGLGLNLTEASYVIHLDPWWNPAIEQQATDRAYRIGQKQNVTVYHLISAHTIEEKILRLHATKRDLAAQLLEGTNVSHKLTANDLLDMLSQ
jgi:SNF2 family DNA or RNA helicase